MPLFDRGKPEEVIETPDKKEDKKEIGTEEHNRMTFGKKVDLNDEDEEAKHADTHRPMIEK
jgi:hypothetical protein